MAVRLFKVAKELNVGTGTLVDHLKKKGFDLDNNPRAKVTDEMYSILVRDFQSSVAIKEQADLLTIGMRPKKKEEEVPKVEPVKEKYSKPSPTAKKVKEVPKGEPKVLAKEVVKELPKEKAKVEVVIEKPAPVEQKKVETPKEEPKPEKPKLEKVEEKPKVVKEKVEDKGDISKKIEKKAKVKPKSTPAKVVQKTEKKAKTSTPKPTAKKEEKSTPKVKKEADKPKKSNKPEEFRAETPTLRGIKILGKIDTSRLKKPEKKKRTAQATKKIKLAGTKVVGKIDLDANKKKPTDSTTSDPAKKRKRKRKKVTPATNTTAKRPQQNRPKPTSDRNRGRGRGRGRKVDEVKEVSKKEVEDKIKATMARLSGGKNKRSRIRRDERDKRRERAEIEQKKKDQENEKLQLTEFISVSEFASLMNIPAIEVITTCMNAGIIVAINQRLDAEIIELVADEFGFEVEFISAEAQMDIEEEEIVDAPEDLSPRAPIVTVMGHVDHGKTSLLDYIRKANVIEGEAGGITQHIGAYEVKVGEEKRSITFLDTPGHEAFTAMRARGAKVTDVAVIIVSADDSVMPQTKEAISHAQAAGVPIIFAINKIDKPGADPDRIKNELARMNMIIEEYGGEYQSQDISAKFGTNVDELLEKILLQADLLEVKANPDRLATGVVLEASLDKGRGYVMKVLVQAGTLKIGDPLVAGSNYGKVRAMVNDRGVRIKKAGPSQPVLILGMKGAPQAGEKFKVMKSEQETRQLATKRAQITSEQNRRATKRLSLEEIARRLALGSFKELNLIVKGDVDGSIEALSDSLIKLSTETVQVNIVHKAVGQIIESDALLASASDAIIIGFQVRPSMGARKLAEREGVQVKLYSIIYDAIEEIKSAIEGMLEPTKEERITASVEIMEVYKISKIGSVAGCWVREGKISRNSLIRVIRDGIVIYPAKEGAKAELGSLKRFKDDVKEVKNGMECGLTIKNFNDIKQGDFVEAYEIVEVKQKL